MEHKFAASFTLEAVDEPGRVIKGIAVITEGQVQGHNDATTGMPIFVDDITVQQIMQSAQTYATGLKVKADHGSGVFAVIGFLNNFRIDGPTLRADFNVFESEPNKDKIFDMARNIPDAFGFSVSFSGEDEVVNNQICARCSEIYSCDLVTEPAANPTGLFSRRKVDASRKSNMAAPAPSPAPKQDKPAASGSPTNAPLPSPEDILTQCNTAMEAIKGHLDRFSQLEAAVAALKPSMPAGDPNSNMEPPAGSASAKAGEEKKVPFDMSALDSKLKEFETKIVGSVASTIAKEFSAKIGQSPAPAPAPAAPTDHPADDPKAEGEFLATVQKHFAETKSQTKALSLTAKELGEAKYQAFIQTGKRINFSKAV